MNFLSHFYFDRNTEDPHQVLGGVLPDLIKNANKAWNLRPEKRQHEFISQPYLQSLWYGWQRHVDVDRYFHNSDFFLEHTQKLRTEIAPLLASSAVRPSFLAHIALELMLDSLLLKFELINAHHFYAHLQKSDRHAVALFLEINQLEDTSRFLNFFDSFLEVNYLHNYRESENIMYALNRICMRIWPEPFTETEKLQLTSVILGYSQNLELVFMNIFEEIELYINRIDMVPGDSSVSI